MGEILPKGLSLTINTALKTLIRETALHYLNNSYIDLYANLFFRYSKRLRKILAKVNFKIFGKIFLTEYTSTKLKINK